MKAAILTLSASDNCGSLLQAYALQQVLLKTGLEVEIINFVTKKSRKMYRIFHPGYVKEPRKMIGLFIRYKRLKNQKNDYLEFRKNYLKMSVQKYSNSLELTETDGKYDLIICGSDQVWNTDMWDFDEAYLMKWCTKSKKAGYAVSLGDKKNDDLGALSNMMPCMDEFDSISVREKSALVRLKSIYKYNIKLCLDPTLLLSSEDWGRIIENEIFPKDPFVFYYSYNYGDDIKNGMVEKFAAEVGLPVYVINISHWCSGKEGLYNFRIFERSGPIAFLSLMKHCRYSLVESFHGTIFSFIFQKSFWFLKNSDDNILDDRINDLMEVLDIKDRVLHPGDILEKVKEDINYQGESAIFTKLKGDSFSFIADLHENQQKN